MKRSIGWVLFLLLTWPVIQAWSEPPTLESPPQGERRQAPSSGERFGWTLPLDSTASLGTRIVEDPVVSSDGKGAIRIETAWPTSVCLGEVASLAIDASQLTFAAKVKTRGFTGTAYLEIWCFVDGGQYFGRGLDSVQTGDADWKELRTSFLLQPGQAATRVVLNLVLNGVGTVWVDDARLDRKSLP